MSDKLGWHVLSGEHLLALLKRCAAGEDPDMVFMELYVNARREQVASVKGRRKVVKLECGSRTGMPRGIRLWFCWREQRRVGIGISIRGRSFWVAAK